MLEKNFELVSDYAPAGDQPRAIAQLVDGLQQGLAEQTVLGVTGSGKTFTLANVIAKVQRPTLMMAPNKTLAAQLYAEMRSFFPNNAVEYFVSYYDYYQPEAYVPTTDTFIEKDASINAHIEQMRLSATKALMERRDTLVVATVSAIYGLGDPEAYFSMVLHVTLGTRIDQRAILRRLAELQYSRNDSVLSRSTYRVRGDLIDIFPADSEETAIRIELFDDEVSMLAVFDPLTGAIVKTLPRVTIYPKTHYATPRSVITRAITDIKAELKERVAWFRQADKLLEAQRILQRTQFDLEMMGNLGFCSGIENYSRYLSGRAAGEPPPTLFDYLPADGLLLLDESHVTIPQLRAMYRGDRSRKENLVNYGFRLPSALDNRPLKAEEFWAIAPQTIFISATPGPHEYERSAAIAELVVRPTGLLDPEVWVRPVATQVDDLLSEIHHCVARNQRVLVTTLTKKMAEDLTAYYDEQGIKVRYLHSDIKTVERVEILRDLRLGQFDVLVGINLLREGLDLPEVALVALLDADKEGFLRSERSLIQTIGRAARHLEGRAILYADKITPAMQVAIDETERRRAKQKAYNVAQGQVPKPIQSPIKDTLPGAQVAEPAPAGVKKPALIPEQNWLHMSEESLQKELGALEQKMLAAAEAMAFEDAAEYRDLIKKLREHLLTGQS